MKPNKTPSQKLQLLVLQTIFSTAMALGMIINASVAWVSGDGWAWALISGLIMVFPLHAVVTTYREIVPLMQAQVPPT